MIFVTVGTHEQPFNRLIECVDNLRNDGAITEEVIMQTGYSTYKPKYCRYQKMFSYDEMIRYVKDARIVITHGGPASFIMPLQMGKIPIVVPRQKQYGEHVNDHQVEFVKAVGKRMPDIITIYDISTMEDAIKIYKEKNNNNYSTVNIHNKEFVKQFSALVNSELEDKKWRDFARK